MACAIGTNLDSRSRRYSTCPIATPCTQFPCICDMPKLAPNQQLETLQSNRFSLQSDLFFLLLPLVLLLPDEDISYLGAQPNLPLISSEAITPQIPRIPDRHIRQPGPYLLHSADQVPWPRSSEANMIGHKEAPLSALLLTPRTRQNVTPATCLWRGSFPMSRTNNPFQDLFLLTPLPSGTANAHAYACIEPPAAIPSPVHRKDKYRAVHGQAKRIPPVSLCR
jgi:hypothetical protein